jgi:hypothetical protein
MADQKQSQTPQRGMQQKQKPKTVGAGGEVGKDIPDESKERHTEIAVEAGRKQGEHDDMKR